MISIDSNGCEFGYELIMCVPFAYYHKSLGDKVVVNSCKGMRSFYYFLDDTEFVEKYNSRGFARPTGTRLKDIHFRDLDTQEFKPLDYTNHFSSHTLKSKFDKELLIISNKYTSEWGHGPVNYLSLECLDELFDTLSPKYDIIYNRPKTSNICDDHQPSKELGDRTIIDNYKNVYDINNLFEQEEIDFNTLQLVLMSKAKNKISVQGGTSIISSFLGGMNKVYAVVGGEVEHDSFKRWYGKLSGCSVNDFQTYQSLIDSVKEDYL